jgi:uncharacterized integral membrane protein
MTAFYHTEYSWMSSDRSNTQGRGEASDVGVEERPSVDQGESDRSESSEADHDGKKREEEGSGREVIVSRELYKVVTVFSTLIAIGAVVGGFIFLDTATNRTLAAPSEVNLPLAIVGVGSIVLGAAVYAFASRFRTQGMGSPNSDADGESGNG